MKKQESTCAQCFEPFAWKAISEDNKPIKNRVFCSQKCLRAWQDREVFELDDKSWKTFVKMINEKR